MTACQLTYLVPRRAIPRTTDALIAPGSTIIKAGGKLSNQRAVSWLPDLLPLVS